MKFRLEKKLKMEFFEGIKKFTKDEFYSFPEEKRNNYFFVTDFKNKEKTVKMLEIAEYLNTYAVHFNTKVADDETGFKTSGIYFCNVVEAFYPVIAMVRKKETDIQYSDIKELYTRWKAKITKLRINEDISELTKLREELSDINFKPLGV